MNRIFAIACIAAISAIGAEAQTAAKVFGTVVDQDGHPVAAATVDIADQKAGFKRSVVAGTDGVFTLPDLAPGTYQISATCPTCNTGSSIVDVSAGQTRNVQVPVNTQSASDVIAVDDHATTMDLGSPRSGMNVTAAEVAGLPVNGRTVAPLAITAPFVANSGEASFPELRFAGQPLQQNRYVLDGIDTSSVVSAVPGYVPVSGYEFRLRSSLDTVEEFRVDSAGYSATDGLGNGGQVKLVSRSGSNAWHGSAFEYFRNDKLNARNYFDNEAAAPLRMNQFGASAGGYVRPNQLFVFGSMEQLKQTAAQNIFDTVPSAEAAAEASPAMADVIGAMPAGFLATSDPAIDRAHRESALRQNESNYSGRVDYLPGGSHRVFLRYSRANGSLITPDETTAGRNVTADSKPDQTVAGWSDQIRANLVNQLTIGLNRSPMSAGALSDTPVLNASRILVGDAVPGGLASPGGLALLANGDFGNSLTYHGRSYNVEDGLEWNKGVHSIQIGGETRLIRVPLSASGGTVYNYRNEDSLFADEDADVTYVAPLVGRKAEQEQYGTYLQDQWRVSPQMLVILGLRYEYATATREQNNQATLLDLNNLTSTSASGGFYSPSKAGFQPRVGITWAPTRLKGNTVLRGGAGLYNGLNSFMDTLWPIENSVSRLFVRGLTYPQTVQDVLGNGEAISAPKALDPGNFGKPQTNYLFTASVQQALKAHFVGELGYVGILSRHLTQESFTNLAQGVDPETGDTIRPFAAFSAVPFLTNGGNSSYHGLHAGLNRRLVDNLTLSASYTWSHSIGDAQGSGEEQIPQNPLCLSCERANNSFDIRHSFNTNAVYELPFGKNRQHFNNGVPAAILGGWTVAGAWNARTGLPVDVTIHRANEIYFSPSAGQYFDPSAEMPGDAFAVTNAPAGLESIASFRPSVVAGVSPYLQNKATGSWLNPAAFTAPEPGTLGNLGRNALRGPGFSQIDLQLSRRVRLTEHTGLQFRVEAFNLLNHANFSNPFALLPDEALDIQPGTPYSKGLAAGFGTVNSTVSRTVGLGTSRQLQLSARFEF